jgi:hypothetical protein
MKIYMGLNGIKEINETKDISQIEKIMNHKESKNDVIVKLIDKLKGMIDEEYITLEKKQRNLVDSVNPLFTEKIEVTSKQNISS